MRALRCLKEEFDKFNMLQASVDRARLTSEECGEPSRQAEVVNFGDDQDENDQD